MLILIYRKKVKSYRFDFSRFRCRTFIKRPTSSAVKWTAYSDPFYAGIWISLLVAMLISSAFIWICFKASPKRDTCDSDTICSSFTETFFYVFGAICAQGMIFHSYNFSLRNSFHLPNFKCFSGFRCNNQTSFNYISTLLGDDEVKLDPIRMINLVVHITGVIILAAYSAALISFLAVKTFTMPFTSMEGLLEDGSYKFGVIRDSADYGFFQVLHLPLSYI